MAKEEGIPCQGSLRAPTLRMSGTSATFSRWLILNRAESMLSPLLLERAAFGGPCKMVQPGTTTTHARPTPQKKIYGALLCAGSG